MQGPFPQRAARLALLIACLLPAMEPTLRDARGDREGWLLRLDASGQEVLDRLAAAGLRPIATTPEFTLVLATPDEEARPGLRALHPARLEAWEAESEYFIAYLQSPRAGGAQPEDFGRVLHRGRSTALLKLDPEKRERFFETFSTWKLTADSPRLESASPEDDFPAGESPTTPKRRGTAPPSRRQVQTRDSAIAQMVDSVNEDVLRMEAQALQDLGTRRSNTPGGIAAQVYLTDRFTSLGYTRVWTHDYNTAFCDNVIAEKPGTVTPERIFVIGGHYDSISSGGLAPGADDNASGTVAVLEAARVMAPYTFESTLYFIGWSGEEQGLIGSGAWCAWAEREGLNIEGYINLDMAGYRSDAKDLDVIFNGPSSWLGDLVFELVPLYVPDLPVVPGYLTWGTSDHASFWRHGFPAVFLFEDSDFYSPFIHTNQDVIGVSLNDFEFMRENVQAAVATLATLAAPVHIVIEHEPLPDTQNRTYSYPVVANIRSVEALAPDSLRLAYRSNGGPFRWSRMLPTANPQEYRAYIPAQNIGTTVEYAIRAADQSGNAGVAPRGAPELLYSFVVGMHNVLVDRFETDLGWTVGAPGDFATAGVWVRADPIWTEYQPGEDHTLDPGALCFVTGNGAPGEAPGVEDVDGGSTSLLSPVFDLDGAAEVRLSYWCWFVDAGVADDMFACYVSNDAGETWTLLHWIRESVTEWRKVTIPSLGRILPLGPRMRLKFVAQDVGNGSLLEAAVDDIELRAYFTRGVEVSEPLPGPREIAGLSFSARPNPAPRESVLSFRLADPAPVEILLFDAGGRLLRRIEAGTLPAGDHACRWDLRDEWGRPVPSGAYFARLEAGSQVAGSAVTVLR